VKQAYARLPDKWKEKYQGELNTPVEYPLSWQWQVMKVGQMNYPWIKEGRAKIDTLFTYVFNGGYAYPEAKICREVLMDEKLVPFHVAIDIGYSETSALADMILPETTALERWDAQATNAWEMVPITGIRQPLVQPPGECRSLFWIYQQLAKRLGADYYKYWDFESDEAYYKAWYKNLPISWEEFKRRGIWWDETREKDFELFERPLTEKDLEGSSVDEKTGLVSKEVGGKKTTIGIMQDDVAVRGFPNSSRKIEVYQKVFEDAGKAAGLENDPVANPLPTYFPVPAHQKMKPGELKFVTFKWNVHTQGRTAHHKYQSEIVHGNPVWMNPETGKSLGLKDGDWIEVIIKRPAGNVWAADETRVTGSFKQYVRLVPGVSKGLLACSHHLGHWQHGVVANGMLKIWWAKSNNGVGTGVHINDAMPIAPTPLSGGQMWYDCVCAVKKL
jgi:thiosulfate reductase/polysulfide reductase chain A